MAEKKKRKPRVRDVTVPGQAGARLIDNASRALQSVNKKKKKKR